MRFRLTCLALACGVALAAGSALAQETEKQQPAPKTKQELAAEEKAAKEKAAAEKAAKEKAEATQPDAQPVEPKAAVNTLEDLFAAYGLKWGGPAREAAPAPEVPIVWKETPAAKPAEPRKAAPQ